MTRNTRSSRRIRRWVTLFTCLAAITAACQTPVNPPTPAAIPTIPPTEFPMPTSPPEAADSTVGAALNNVIPKPVSVTPAAGVFALTAAVRIYVEPGSGALLAIGEYLAERLRPATGFELPVVASNDAADASLVLTTANAPADLGDEGYELTITPQRVMLIAYQPAGLFRGVQTIRQLLPPAIESSTLQPGPWAMPAGTVRDHPRFEWRGAMLDVARHFFGVDDVRRFLDLMAYYKLNRFHLHLSDDQGWRIMINAWPRLAEHGGSTEVGGGPGGYYTQAEYAEIVAYAESRYITLVPEIDMPGHTNAALASYPELNCNGVAPDLYTGTNVGFSSLCIEKEITYQFVDDVIGELAALTPGPYIHIGGDEAAATKPTDYVKFIEQVQTIVRAHGKQVLGWEDIAQAELEEDAVVQHWNSDVVRKAVQQGARVIMSPASRVYLDIKYDRSTPLGLEWAGLNDVEDAYTWDPTTQVPGLFETVILGVEAPLWSETLETIRDIEFMAFPRLIGVAEIGWSPKDSRSWDEYRTRLGAHGARLQALEVNFFRAPQVPW